MTFNNPTIQLVPDSIYIVTTYIMGPAGEFHWSICITDQTGAAATKYHWAQLEGNTGQDEGVVVKNIQPVRMYSRTGRLTFGFFHVSQFKAPSTDYMNAFTKNIFDAPHTSGYSTIYENRINGLTCRTWAMTVYEKLQAAGLITRKTTRDEIEAIVKEKTIELAAMAGKGELIISGHIKI
ncbi:hypothetical protein CPB83DRAFT_845033 [Crepidotus variabilis]|uniref:Uncharacterized protein n=1 Tax=Crepidotus variabilis TaxID=179855 RepID=A0A9P6JVJ8_9AGAR|nr:hypothetical protein CPB83DRAFT_845033 [Crepidotus variabilis]